MEKRVRCLSTQYVTPSLIPRPLLFFGLQFAFSRIHREVESGEEQGRAGTTYHVRDIRWMRGGYRGGWGHVQIMYYIECSTTS